LCCPHFIADPALAPEGQDSRVVGVTSLMFHDRRVSLQKMKRLRPALSSTALDYSLWLACTPPDDLEYDKAAFIWWTATNYKCRRWGQRLN
jgi:hypothetical protein